MTFNFNALKTVSYEVSSHQFLTESLGWLKLIPSCHIFSLKSSKDKMGAFIHYLQTWKLSYSFLETTHNVWEVEVARPWNEFSIQYR